MITQSNSVPVLLTVPPAGGQFQVSPSFCCICNFSWIRPDCSAAPPPRWTWPNVWWTRTPASTPTGCWLPSARSDTTWRPLCCTSSGRNETNPPNWTPYWAAPHPVGLCLHSHALSHWTPPSTAAATRPPTPLFIVPVVSEQNLCKLFSFLFLKQQNCLLCGSTFSAL